MLHKCANPDCARPFRRLAEGKLFLFEMAKSLPLGQAEAKWDGQAPPRVEHFWLCEQCAAVLTLSFEKGRGMVTVPLPEAVRKRPASMCDAATVPQVERPPEHSLLKRA
ncbi:MAG: hypothetical protein WB952_21265 [Terriglobales bacterium]